MHSDYNNLRTELKYAITPLYFTTFCSSAVPALSSDMEMKSGIQCSTVDYAPPPPTFKFGNQIRMEMDCLVYYEQLSISSTYFLEMVLKHAVKLFFSEPDG